MIQKKKPVMKQTLYEIKGVGNYLKDSPLPLTQQEMLQEFDQKGYLRIKYLWPQESLDYLFRGYFNFQKDSFIVNHLYYSSFNLTLFQIIGPKHVPWSPIPIFWCKGQKKLFQIGDTIRGEFCIIQRKNPTRDIFCFVQKIKKLSSYPQFFQ